jgi:hypothetical protein
MAWRWVERVWEYIESITDRILSVFNTNALVDRIVDRGIDDIESLTDAISRGDITVDGWHGSMRERIKQLYEQLTDLGAGGHDKVTDAQWSDATRRLFEQYKFLDNFARQITEGKLTKGQIERRSKMYVNSSRQTYWSIRNDKAKARFTREKWNAIGDDNTCGPCADADAMGWQPLGTFAEPASGIVVVGETFCEGLTACRCTKIFR